MRQSMYTIIRTGMHYSKVWPMQPELNGVFPENRMIRLTQWAQRVLPGIAVLNAVLQYQWHGASQLPLLIAMSLLLLSIPLQGWYWLGVRSRKRLPPAVRQWYQQIMQQMQLQGVAVVPAPQAPEQTLRYYDLGQLLQQAYRQLDKAFIRNSL
ncbi:terminus macrodomain insulation protein YfbV [Alkalimonas sp. NCh-2]|uniref:terminus macrodomain insulation protein YfbV n=1 Tax=Alkalimonas sp. NCh-2 TaxID=3144846 RepID=UPI0031F6E1C7